MHLKKITLCPERYPNTEHYPFSLPLIQETEKVFFKSAVTFFVGENGSGKITSLGNGEISPKAKRFELEKWRYQK